MRVREWTFGPLPSPHSIKANLNDRKGDLPMIDAPSENAIELLHMLLRTMSLTTLRSEEELSFIIRRLREAQNNHKDQGTVWHMYEHLINAIHCAGLTK